ALARFFSDGSLDTSFDGDGRRIEDLGGGEEGYQVALQANGKIIFVGYTTNVPSGLDFVVLRYNSNGSLDTTFSGDGVVTTDFGSNQDAAAGAAIQSDGRIVVAGYTHTGGPQDFAVARYLGEETGGRNFTIDSEVAGRIMSWQTGTLQTGYTLL